MKKPFTIFSGKNRAVCLALPVLMAMGLLLSPARARAQLQAKFEASSTMGCGQLGVNFTDESTGNPSQWTWNFGNGTSASHLQNPSATFTQPGTYPVTLTVSNGLNTSTSTSYITVYENPTVKFTPTPPSGCYPLNVQFTDQSSSGTGTITHRTWDFGDGSPFSSEADPTHRYDSAGTFLTKLSVTNSAGCTNSANVKVVTNEGIVVNFKADQTFSCAAPLTVNFTSSTSSAETVNYQWDFGDGGKGSGPDATHTYTRKGSYSVTLTASVGAGACPDVVTKESYIRIGDFSSDFTIPQGCANTPLSFKNVSAPLPSSATWKFSDGATVTGINATHRFAKAGTYQVTLINKFGGCEDSVKKTITTYPSPVADFSSAKLAYCGTPVSVAFDNHSTGATSWKWNFGDGASSTAQTPTHSYQSGGAYTVSLVAVSQNGCTDSAGKTGYISVDAPDIRFNAASGFGCAPLTTTLSIPAASAADIASYAWDFGDGSPVSTAAKPSHTFNSGDFTVTLDVVTKSGCKFSFSRDSYIHTGDKPVVAFTADPRSACRETPIQFTNQSVPPGASWVWDFPDDKSTDSSENPRHRFNELGSQDVTLTVNNNGCMNTLTKPGYIQINPPKAVAGKSVASCADPYTIQFTGEHSQGASTYEWNFGDGTTSSEKNPAHKYATPGAKLVTLKVTNGACSSMDTVFAQVVDEKPVITATPGTVCRGDSVTLSLGSVNVPQFLDSIYWYDGAGHTIAFNTGDGSLPSATFDYKKNGDYIPSIRLDYINNCAATVEGPAVHVQGPTASFATSSMEICQGDQISFTDHSQSDPAGAGINRWIWQYGDGSGDTTATRSVVTHLYPQDGQFKSQLTVTDVNGCSASTARTANVVTVNPSKADFSTTDTLVCPGSPVRWNNASLGTGNTYLWDFGDGSTSGEANPPATYYRFDSLYTVSLKVITDKGCRDSLTRNDYIHVGAPRALMDDSSNVRICRIYMDTAINRSKNYRSILWDFGDGFTSTLDTAYHIYNLPGTYIQELIVQGYSPGCTDTAKRIITIAGPVGTAVIDDSSGCFPHRVNFSAKNVFRAVSYQWFFGDGSVSDLSTSSHATYTYEKEGVFHPTLKLTDDTGCFVIVPIQDSLTVVVDSIGVIPKSSWQDQCDSNQVSFTTEGSIFSVDQLGDSATYHWDFGDPSTIEDVAAARDASYRYGSPGTYLASVTIQTQYGCSETIPLQVTVPDSTILRVSATSDLAEICDGKSVRLHASSNLAERYEWAPVTGIDDPDSQNPTATPDVTTTYQVTATSPGNCQTDTAQVRVVVHDNPRVDAGPDLTATTGSLITLQATGSPDITGWKWSPPDYLSCTSCQDPTSAPQGNMEYIVQVANSFGCTSSDTLKINLVCDEGKVFIPNTFTPNHDGQNDLFYPRGRGVKEVLYFRIYNRFGQLVFERTRFQLNDQSAGWDGTMKGQPLNPDVFVYTTQMVCDNDKIFKLSGNVTLLR